jgi:hypothetical protein
MAGLACFRETRNQLAEYGRVEPLGTNIIQKEQRFRSGYCDIINAMINEILRDRFVLSEADCNL